MRSISKLPMRMGCISSLLPAVPADLTQLDCSAASRAIPSAIGRRGSCSASRKSLRWALAAIRPEPVMRTTLVVSLMVFLCPASALAQTPPADSSAPPAAAQTPQRARNQGQDITRDEYVERAKRAAEKRFDRMDTNHDGVWTLDERRAARSKRRGPDSQ